MRFALIALFAPSLAYAQTITFDNLDVPGTGNSTVDDVTGDIFYYSDQGFEFNAITTPYGYYRWHMGDANWAGSTHMFDNTVNGITELTSLGGPFTITQIDLAELIGGAASVTFTGTQAGGTVVTTTFQLDGITPSSQTFTFPPNFTNLDMLSWSQANNFHQFDNLVLGGGGGGFQVFVATSCPSGGQGSISWAGATPSSQVAILGAASGGSASVPGGPCAGTVTGLGPMSLIGILGSDVNGTGALGGVHTMQDCGTNIQLLDIATCTVSNVQIAQ